MALTTKIYEWAKTGAASVPNTAKIALGWVFEQPWYQYLNWWMNRADRKLNDLIHESNWRGQRFPGQSFENYMSNLFPSLSDGLNPDSNANTQTFTSPNRALVQMCRGWNYDLRKEVIYGVNKNDNQEIVEVRNGDDGFMTVQSRAITPPVSSDQADAICCDGPYIYVFFRDISNFIRIAKYPTNPWSATAQWSRSINYLANTEDIGKNAVIVADSNHVVALSATPGSMFHVIAKDNSTYQIGSGNIPVSSRIPNGGICSDGTYIYASVFAGGVGPIIGSALITNPTIGNLSISYTDTSAVFGSLVFDGKHLIFIRRGVGLNYWDITNGYWDETVERPLNGSTLMDEAPIIFDGLRIWYASRHTPKSYENPYVSNFSTSDLTIDQTIYTPVASGHITTDSIRNPKVFLGDNTDTTNGVIRLAYADNTLWITREHTTGTGDNHLYRMPNLLNRP